MVRVAAGAILLPVPLAFLAEGSFLATVHINDCPSYFTIVLPANDRPSKGAVNFPDFSSPIVLAMVDRPAKGLDKAPAPPLGNDLVPASRPLAAAYKDSLHDLDAKGRPATLARQRVHFVKH
jgi:hypothetical protein